MKSANPVFCFILALCFCASSLTAAPVEAHRLNVFAWLENNEIMVECNYGNKRPVIDAQVTILDKDTGQTLTRGTTDNTGHFAFAVPQVIRDGHTLAIDVNAGDGHRSEWIMPASELYGAASLSAGFKQEAIEEATQNPAVRESPASVQMSPSPNMPQAMGPRPGSQIGPEHLRIMIRDEMEQQLAPIRRTLASQSADGPGVAEIIGGLGWIVGLTGIVLFFLGRRREKENH